MARIAIIGGTGAGLFPRAAELQTTVLESGWGEASAPVQSWTAGAHEVCFLARHGDAGLIPPHRVNYRANIDGLAALQPDAVIALNAVGGIAPTLAPGHLCVPHNLVDYTWGRAHTFYDSARDEQNFLEFTDPYDNNLRSALINACAAATVPFDASGVYGVTQGPRLETAAEIDRLERDGCAVVGMTSMPEASLAAEAGLSYACLALVVNHAAGRSDQSIHGDMEEHLATAVERAAAVIEQFLLDHD